LLSLIDLMLVDIISHLIIVIYVCINQLLFFPKKINYYHLFEY